jgi:hypothetical protein
LELLEDRALPSTLNWIGGSGNWNDSSHWQDPITLMTRVPTATDDAVINVGGVTVTHGNSGTDPAQSIMITNGTLSLTAGTLDVSGAVSGAGAFVLSGGTLAHANVSLGITFTTTSGSTLSGVTLSANQDLASASGTATVTSGLTLANNAVISLGNNSTTTPTIGRLLFQGTQTLGGTGAVLFGGSTGNGLGASGSAALTLGPNILVHGKNGSIDLGTQTFINQGTISSDVAGGTIILNGVSWSNTGAIQSSNGGNLTLNSTSGSTATTPWTNAGTITAAGGTLTLGRFSNPFSGTDYWSNTGTITASNNATVNLNGQFTTASVTGPGTFNGSGVTVNLVGTLDNTSTTLALTAATGSWNLMGGTIMGGTVSEAGGAALICTSSGGTLDTVTFNGDLDLATLNNAQASVKTSLTLNNATINLGNSSGTTSGKLSFFSATETLGGTGTVLLGGNSSNSLVIQGTPFSSVALTIGPNILVHGKSGSIGPIGGGSQTLMNQGTINADLGGTITVSAGTWTNNGTIGAQDSSTITAPSAPTNFAAGTLTGGTWRVLANGTLRLMNANISTNAATILLDGANSNFYRDNATTDALANFATNNGSFSLLDGRNFTTAGNWSNSGSLTIGAGSTLTVNGNYTQASSGSLTVQLAGTAAGQFSQVIVSGLATLAGALNVTEVGGFTPAAGDTYQVMSFGSRSGDFATKTGFQLGNGLFFREDLHSTDLTLEAFLAQLVFQQQPTDTTAGQSISPAVTVAIVDPATGTPIAFDNTDTVTVSLNGGGALGGTLTQTVSGGVATFADLSITQAGTGNMLNADSAGLATATSSAFAINPAAAFNLQFSQQPTDTPAGQTISQVIVQVVDQFGNVVTSDNSDVVTLTLTDNPMTGATLSGTVTMTVANGVATFSDLSINLAGAGYTLHATNGSSLPDIDSNTFNIT